MNTLRRFRFWAMVLFLAPALGAVPPASQPETHPAPEPRVIRMTLHPSAATESALRRHLLPDVTERTPGNAAVLYDLFCNRPPLDERAAEDLGDRLDRFNDADRLSELSIPDMTRTLGQFETRLKYADMAARRDEIHWDTTIRQEGVLALLPYLNYQRITGRMLSVRARLEMAQHDWPAAIRTLQTGFSMTSQLNDEPVLVQGLVEAGLGEVFLERVYDWQGEPGAPNLYWALTDLPQPFIDLRAIAQWERATCDFTFPQLRDVPERRQLTDSQWREVESKLAELVSRREVRETREPPGADRSALAPQARHELIEMGIAERQASSLSAEQAVGTYWLLRYRILSDQLWKAWTLPYTQSEPVLRQAGELLEREKAHDGNPFLILLTPLDRARFHCANLDRRIRLARTIEALRDYAAHHGQPPGSLDQIQDLPIPNDPCTGRPFPYESNGRRATLTAAAPSGFSANYTIRFELTFAN